MSQQEQVPQGQQIQVKTSDDVLKGVYANMMQIGHTPEEFILDFMSLFPPAGILSSRVIVSPSHMKRIVAALQDNLQKYEQQFGKIKESQAPQHKVGFRTE
ncbi:MAG: DUF3467 domain-containing protein [Patescibacteria group bacterium]|nr:DUF3467 domain-containing protein [Patescibacteria group bacterium]